MKKHNRFIAGIMTVCLAFGVVIIPESITPVVSMAESSEEYYTYKNLTYTFLKDGTIIIIDCDESATEVVIPSEIDGVPVTTIGEYAFDFSDITSVKIPDSITSIGECAFWGCASLTSVTIPDSITSINMGTFSCCSNLTSVTIPDSVTSIGIATFSYCESLTSVTIPNSVTSIGNRAFFYCKGLTSVTIPDSITSIDMGVFRGCSNLTSVTIPDSVTSIGNSAFSYCDNLTSVTIPDSVTSIGDAAFFTCENLTEITILNPNCNFYFPFTFSNEHENFTGTIYGYENSTAQEYAEKFDRKFVALDDVPTATGDLNGDNEFNVSDLVLLQKYISGDSDTKISDWKNADLYPDGILDVFDLCLMRKKLIEK